MSKKYENDQLQKKGIPRDHLYAAASQQEVCSKNQSLPSLSWRKKNLLW